MGIVSMWVESFPVYQLGPRDEWFTEFLAQKGKPASGEKDQGQVAQHIGPDPSTPHEKAK